MEAVWEGVERRLLSELALLFHGYRKTIVLFKARHSLITDDLRIFSRENVFCHESALLRERSTVIFLPDIVS